MLVDVDGGEVGVEQQRRGVDVDRGLSPALVAQIPLRIDEAPEGRTCRQKRHY